MKTSFATLFNGVAAPYSSIPQLSYADFAESTLQYIQEGLRICSYFGTSSSFPELMIVLANDRNNTLLAGRAQLGIKQFPSLTPQCPQAHLFEREIYEQCGFIPDGHPWLKPVRFAKPLAAAASPLQTSIDQFPMFRIHGGQAHEVAVGPIHAGVIEPGHFRFQCHGEQVFHLEISLGYQHRGVEEALLGGPHKLSSKQIEAVAGDSTIAHSIAYQQNLEALMEVEIPPRAQILRSVALELERLANHCGTLGALAGDVGYLPTQSFCGKLRGDFLNLTALICGSRFGRNCISLGGVSFDLDATMIEELLKRLQDAKIAVTHSVNLLWDSPSVMGRFENCGVISREQCQELGFVGPVARSCGIDRDVRTSHPVGVYQFHYVPVSTMPMGDVHSRAFVRFLELRRSLRFIREQLDSIPDGEIVSAGRPLAPGRFVVSLCEGHRGEICHVAMTNSSGALARYKITDPSFHNWLALALAMRNQQISDFPLCNKSFDLSYCGFDL